MKQSSFRRIRSQTVDSQALIPLWALTGKELTLLCWSVLPLDCYNKGALKESWHQVEVGASPRLMLLQLNAAFFLWNSERERVVASS